MIEQIEKEIREYFHKHIDEKGIEIDLLDVSSAIMDILEKHKLQEQKWISVEERLPEKEGCYLVVLDFGKYKPRTIAQYQDGEFYNKAYYIYYPSKDTKVIAWMPLPEYHFAEADKKIGGADD